MSAVYSSGKLSCENCLEIVLLMPCMLVSQCRTLQRNSARKWWFLPGSENWRLWAILSEPPWCLARPIENHPATWSLCLDAWHLVPACCLSHSHCTDLFFCLWSDVELWEIPLSHYMKELGGELSDTPFLRVLRSDTCSGTVALMDKDATPFSRMGFLSCLATSRTPCHLPWSFLLPSILPLGFRTSVSTLCLSLSLSHFTRLLSDIISWPCWK